MTLGVSPRLQRNLVVTGMPRGGTTLLAALIDSSASAYCLSEPNWPVAASDDARDPLDFIQRLEHGIGARVHSVRRAD